MAGTPGRTDPDADRVERDGHEGEPGSRNDTTRTETGRDPEVFTRHYCLRTLPGETQEEERKALGVVVRSRGGEKSTPPEGTVGQAETPATQES